MPTDEEKSIFLKELEKEVNIQKKTDDLSNDTNNQKQANKSKKMSATALFAAVFMLSLLLVTLFIFIIRLGGPNNPILKTLKVPEDQVKEFLLSLVNGTFATFGIIIVLLFTISIFIGFSTKKEEKLKRRGSLVFSAVCGGLTFLVVMLWLAMFNFVNAMNVGTSSAYADILIVTPKETENIKAPIDITFSAEKIRKAIEDREIAIAGYRWDFGSGTFQQMKTEDIVTHRYDTSGKFIVRVGITAKNGETQIFEKELQIQEAEFEATPTTGNAPLRVEFDATTVTRNLSPDYFDWDFDNNEEIDQSTNSPKISYTFEKIGEYTTKLRVVDSDGNVKTFFKKITVKGESMDKMQAKIEVSPDVQGSIPFKVNFDASSSFSTDGKIISYKWNFGDGSSEESGQKVDHIFEKIGEYSVKLKIIDDLGSERNTEINIIAKNPEAIPQAIIKTDPIVQNDTITGSVPLTIRFDAADSTDSDKNITLYEWDFDGDGIIDSKGQKTEHTFREIGEFQSTLKISDIDGNTSLKTLKIVTQKQSIRAEIIASPETGPVPLNVKFDASSSKCDEDNCSIVSYEWDFGDGSKPQLFGAQAQRVFSKVGIYDVKLKIYTSNNKEATALKKIFVREIPLTACFEPSRRSGAAPLTISLDPSCSIGPINNWHWDFSDGKISNNRRPNYTYYQPGEYTISLRVTDDKNNISEVSQIVTVE